MRTNASRYLAPATTLLVLGVSLLLFWVLTRGLTAFTSETWRRAAVAESPRLLPNVVLQDQDGQVFDLHELCGQVLLVNFFYTQCPGVCNALGSEFAQLAGRLDELIRSKRVVVLSVSFDPNRDDRGRLASFRRQWAGSDTAWRVVRAPSAQDTQRLLDVMGVVVIPDRRGGFDHNAATHLVDQSCRLAQIVDIGDMDRAEFEVRRRM